MIIGFSAKIDLQLKSSYVSSPPCRSFRRVAVRCSVSQCVAVSSFLGTAESDVSHVTHACK